MTQIDYSSLPPHMQGAMQRYIEERIPPGGFLTAVLCNDFMGACRKADDTNRHHLFDFAFFLYNNAPASCFGSPDAVERWLADED